MVWVPGGRRGKEGREGLVEGGGSEEIRKRWMGFYMQRVRVRGCRRAEKPIRSGSEPMRVGASRRPLKIEAISPTLI